MAKTASSMAKGIGNKLINNSDLFDDWFGGIFKSADGILNRSTLHSNKPILDIVKDAHKIDGKYSAKRIAGSVFGVSAAARIATGGGILKDKNGNTNVIGIPFV